MPFAVNKGVRIRYEVEGSGTPLVMMHGGVVSLEMWRDLGYTDALRADHRLILIDARAHGQSDKPHDPLQYRQELMVGDVVAVLDDLAVAKAHYIGASMGAAIGFQMARYAPDRLHSLALLGYGRYGPLTEAEQQFHAIGRRMYEMAAGMGAEAALAAIERPERPLPPEFKAQFLSNDWQALLAFQDGFDEWPGFEDVLPKIAVPCLVVVTEGDAFYSSAKKCAEVMPRATFVALEGGVHNQESYLPDRVVPHLRSVTTGAGRV